MATIRLKNKRTGVWNDYQLAYFDWSAWTGDGGSDTQGSIITGNTGLPSSVIGSQDKYYVASVTDAYKYLIDTVKPETAGNLLYIPAGTKWRDIFTPTLDSSPSTYVTPPASYNTYGEYWQCMPDANMISGVHQITKGPAAFDITKTYYGSTQAAVLYDTYNGGHFGISCYVGQKWINYPRDNTDGVVIVGGKQYVFTESGAYNSRYNIEWSPSMNDVILDNDAGDYRSTYSVVEYGDANEYPDAMCPTKYISTQPIYTIRNGEHLCGVASISWEFDTFGDLRPASFTVNFIPLWFWGQISGEFVPNVPDIDEMPVTAPDTGLGSYTLNESPAGVAMPPAVSPIANIDTTHGGMHVFVCDAAAIAEIEDQLWSQSWKNSEQGITAAMSGIIACGFMPDDLIGPNYAEATYKRTQIELGGYPITLTNGNAYIINHRIFRHESLVTFGSGSGEPLTELFHSYHDYEPFTQVKLTVPFCGELSIPASACIGGSISVDMSVNLTTGDICATVTAVSSDRIRNGLLTQGALTTNYYLFGNAFSRFPILGSSNGMSQYVAGGVQAISGAASILSGGVIGAVAGGAQLLGGVQNLINAQNQPVHGAAPIGSPSIIGNKSIVLEVTRPSPYIDGHYKAMMPPASEEVQTIGSCKLPADDAATVNGYTPIKVKEVYFDNTDSLSEAELIEIERLLKGGVLL